MKHCKDKQVEVTIHGKSYFISEKTLMKLEEMYLKELEEKKKNPGCYSGSYATIEDFRRIGFDDPY